MTSRQASIPEVIIQGPTKQSNRITVWLERHGIPVNNNRILKPKKFKKSGTSEGSKTSISASNVTATELETYLDWSFEKYEDIDPNTTGLEKVLKGIAELLDPVSTSQGKVSERDIGMKISIPSEWKEDMEPMSSDGGEGFWHQALIMFLTYYDPNGEYTNYLPKEKIEAAQYPSPNIFHMYNEAYEGGGIARSLTNTLASPTFKQSPDTEMKVEHLVSGFMNGYFNVPDCKTTSNAQLKFRDAISCFGSHPRPDFAAHIKEGIILEPRLKYDLYPAIHFGEAKTDLDVPQNIQPDRLQVSSKPVSTPGFQFPKKAPEDAERLDIGAQLAFAAYPSLVIIVASLIMEWQSKAGGKRLDRKEYRIPEYAVLYGIGYAGNGILIYAFFPHVVEWDKNNFPKKWGFMSCLVTTAFINVFSEERVERFKLIRALLIIQQHANRLKNHLKSKAFRLPEEFLD